MSIRNLDKIFHPERVAVIGASDTRTSVGYTVLRNLIGSGFEGVVYPVNPKRESVQGIQKLCLSFYREELPNKKAV